MSKRDGGGSLANADVLLLESGNLADATIVCAHRTWNVHKLILSSRSKWFSTAFNGHLKEAKTGNIVFEEQDPELIDILLRFIYARGGDIPELRRGSDIPSLCVRIFRLGDFIMLHELKEKAAAMLKAHLGDLPVALLDDEPYDDQNPIWVTEVLDAFDEAYKDGSTKSILGIMVDFLYQNKHHIFRFKGTLALLDRIPQIVTDLMKTPFVDDLVAPPRSTKPRLGLPVLRAVGSEGGIYDCRAAERCLLYPIVGYSSLVFTAIDPETDRETKQRLSWLTPDPTRTFSITSHPDSEIVCIWYQPYLQPKGWSFIRFGDCCGASVYVERYCKANPGIKSGTADGNVLRISMHSSMAEVLEEAEC